MVKRDEVSMLRAPAIEQSRTLSHTHPQWSCCASHPQKVKQFLTQKHLGLVLFFVLLEAGSEEDAGQASVLIGLLFGNERSPHPRSPNDPSLTSAPLLRIVVLVVYHVCLG